MSDLSGLERTAFAELDASMMADVVGAGTVRAVERGEILYRAGDEDPDFFAILDGDVEILLGDTVVTARGAGGFLGELNMVTGQRPYLTARSPLRAVSSRCRRTASAS